MPEVIVIDYGCGNIQSLERALKRLDISSEYTSNIKKIKQAQKIILPGVGSYATGMSRLKKIGLIEVIKEFSNSGKPLLGVCLGMQLLLDFSEEFGLNKGLGIIHGSVTKIKPNDGSKVPHTGWNSIELPQGNEIDYWNDPILNEISPGKDFYFVHSYMVRVNQSLNNIAETAHGGTRFSSIIRNGNVYGCQFHPEKSGAIGSKFLKNFLNI